MSELEPAPDHDDAVPSQSHLATPPHAQSTGITIPPFHSGYLVLSHCDRYLVQAAMTGRASGSARFWIQGTAKSYENIALHYTDTQPAVIFNFVNNNHTTINGMFSNAPELGFWGVVSRQQKIVLDPAIRPNTKANFTIAYQRLAAASSEYQSRYFEYDDPILVVNPPPHSDGAHADQ